MKKTRQDISILGLSRLEEEILEYLKPGNLASMTDISAAIQVSRTTLYTPLSHLKARGFITMKKHGKHFNISKVPNSILREKLGGALGMSKGEHTVRISDDIGFAILYGKSALLAAWQDVSMRKGHRIQAIESNTSMLSAIQVTSPADFVQINKNIKKNKIIMEAVLREDYYRTYMNYWRKNKKTWNEIVSSLVGRMADTVLVSPDYLNSNAELLISGNLAYILNWETETGLKIRNPDMIAFLQEVFDLVRGYGKKVDQNEALLSLK